ncbi:ABC transporter permease [Reinekea thalattae]|nr:iron ABC transporter permease [Reinekea thalattae]
MAFSLLGGTGATVASTRWLRPLLFWLTTALLLLLVGLPVLAIVAYALFPHINEWSFAQPFSAIIPSLSDLDLLSAIGNSLVLSFSVTLLSVVIALPLAIQRQHLAESNGRLWDALMLVPFLIPPYIGAMSWMQLLQRRGFIEQLFGFNLNDLLYSFPGLVIVMSLHLFPMIYVAASQSLRIIGQRYGDVARVFGGQPWPIFFRIQLPLVSVSLLASGLMVFVLTFEEFGTPEILGSRFGFEVIVTSIHKKFTDWPIDLPGASVLSLILIGIAFAAFKTHGWLTKRFTTDIDTPLLTATKIEVPRYRSIIANGWFCLVAIPAVILPVVTIAISASQKTLTGGLAWSNLGLQHFIAITAVNSEPWQALTTSLLLAFGAALGSVGIALLVAFTLVRMQPKGLALLDFLSLLPNALPGMAVAVGLILTWNQSFWPMTPYNSSAILLLAYMTLTLPYPIRTLTAALKQLPLSLDEAGYVFGASELRVLLRVLWPLIAPVALASGFIVFAISSRELVSSLMLAPPGVNTVATYVFHQFDQGSVNAGMAMSLVTILVSGSIIRLGQSLTRSNML